MLQASPLGNKKQTNKLLSLANKKKPPGEKPEARARARNKSYTQESAGAQWSIVPSSRPRRPRLFIIALSARAHAAAERACACVYLSFSSLQIARLAFSSGGRCSGSPVYNSVGPGARVPGLISLHTDRRRAERIRGAGLYRIELASRSCVRVGNPVPN